MSAADWSRYWREAGAQTGQSFLGDGVGDHEGIARFWGDAFQSASPTDQVVDVASGAGAVLSFAKQAGLSKLFATDIAPEAIEALSARLPGVRGIVCGVDAIPLPDQSAHWVTSQFGVEYAPESAIAEMARLVAKSGMLRALIHYRDGAITRQASRDVSAVAQFLESDFVEAYRALIGAAFAQDASAMQAAAARFAKVEPQIAALAKTPGAGLIAHFHSGARQLWDRRAAYAETDITGWVDGMMASLLSFRHRMEAMLAAAKDEAGIHSVADTLSAAGLSAITVTPLTLYAGDPPAAWAVSAKRG